MDKAPVRSARPASLARDTRGATMQEYLVMTAVVALASATTWAAFGRDAASVLVGDSAADSLAAHPPAFERPTITEPGGVVCFDGVCTLPDECFVAGTLVETARGLVPIEEIEVGDTVLTLDSPDAEPVEHEVLATFRTEDRPVLEIAFVREDDPGRVLTTLGVTPEHPFWGERGWVGAGSLDVGDRVLSLHSGWLRVGSATRAQQSAVVFNLEVDDSHTYLVGEDGIWAHNQCRTRITNSHGGRVATINTPGTYTVDHSSGIRTSVRAGHNGRIEEVSSTYTSAPPTGTSTTTASRAHARSLGGPCDDAGHMIPSRLGGYGGKANVVPIDPATNRGAMRVAEATIADIVEAGVAAGHSMRVVVRPVYASATDTRPIRVEYEVYDNGVLTHTDSVTNPPGPTPVGGACP